MRAVELNLFCEYILRKRISLFGGAGISFSSGLPIANQLLEEVYGALPLPQDKRAQLLSSNLPFEAVFEKILEHTDASALFDIFMQGNPCGFHLLAAELAVAGQLDGVMTTNFDLLFERSFAQRSIAYRKLLGKHDLCSDREVNIYKIHGCAENSNDLAITIRKVANQKEFEEREDLLERFLCGSKGIVLVAGYSCSDKFDITPILQNKISPSNFVVFLEHDSGRSSDVLVEPLNHFPNNAFSKFSGIKVKACTDSVVSTLRKSIVGSTPVTPTDRDAVWRGNVSRWMKFSRVSRGTGIASVVAAELLRLIALHKDAAMTMERIRPGALNHLSEGKGKLLLGDILREVGKTKESKKSYSSSFYTSKANDQILTAARALNGIGMTLADQKKFDLAICFYKGALATLEKLTKQDLLYSTIDGNWAICLKNKGGLMNLKLALRKQKQTTRVCRRHGDSRAEGRSVGNLGIIYSHLGRKKKQ